MTHLTPEEGRYKPYGIEYPYKGETWCFEIYATSFEEATERLNAMVWGKVYGEIMGSIPAVPGAGRLVRFVCWIRNQMHERKQS